MRDKTQKVKLDLENGEALHDIELKLDEFNDQITPEIL